MLPKLRYLTSNDVNWRQMTSFNVIWRQKLDVKWRYLTSIDVKWRQMTSKNKIRFCCQKQCFLAFLEQKLKKKIFDTFWHFLTFLKKILIFFDNFWRFCDVIWRYLTSIDVIWRQKSLFGMEKMIKVIFNKALRNLNDSKKLLINSNGFYFI